MLRRYNRLLVACYVVADLFSAAAAFLLAYFIRFDTWFVALAAYRSVRVRSSATVCAPRNISTDNTASDAAGNAHASSRT